MTTSVRYAIGTEVHCKDEPYGELKRVVLDPVAHRVTHLVVGGRHDTDRLVPVELVDEASSDSATVRLRCAGAAVRLLDPAEEQEYLPGTSEHPGSAPEQLATVPYYSLGVGTVGMGSVGMAAPGLAPVEVAPSVTVHERVPTDEVQIRHGDRVEATDGEVGHVQGLVVDPRYQEVTHVLLQEGHLWGRKTVAIPIGEVTWRAGHVAVRLSKADLGDLPPVDVHAH
ncbi:hypothetical protein [Kitasatospora nipponensis]|uniref:hypothetical protein n=1 Tax=Kitasatospora nipponensis TaxID=258049 RepID=UPI0031E08475